MKGKIDGEDTYRKKRERGSLKKTESAMAVNHKDLHHSMNLKSVRNPER